MSSAVVVASAPTSAPVVPAEVAKDKEERRAPVAIDISKSKVPVPRIHIKLNPDAVNEISYQKLLTQYVDVHPEATIFKPVAADEAIVPSHSEPGNRTSGSEADAPGKQIDLLKQLLGPEQDDTMPGPKNRFTSLMESWLVRLEKTGLLAHPDDITASKKGLGKNAKKKKHKKQKLDGVVDDGSQKEESSAEDESKYDLDDPWLDDSELVLGDESHENMQTEQSGYFVNKGDISIVRRPKHAIEPEMSDSPFEKKRKRSKVPVTANDAPTEKLVEPVEGNETVEKAKRKRKRKTFHDEVEPKEEPVKPVKPSKKTASNETEEPSRKKKKKATDASATEKKTEATVSSDVADVADVAESQKSSKKKSKSKTSLPLSKETAVTTPTGKKEKKDKTVSKTKETKEDHTGSSKQPGSAPESSGPTWGETFDSMPKFDENHFKIARFAAKTGGSHSGSTAAQPSSPKDVESNQD